MTRGARLSGAWAMAVWASLRPRAIARVALILAVAAACGDPGDEPAAADRRGAAAADDSAFAALQRRGGSAGGMGVDQYASVHRFDDLPDGGRITLRDTAGADSAVDRIRSHMKEIARAFQRGDFSTPAFVHDTPEVPGTDVMTRRRDAVRYTYLELPRGGGVRIESNDSVAIGAIHAFLAFQRTDHRAPGDEMMDHGAMDHGAMDDGAMDHGATDQGAMERRSPGGPAAADTLLPVNGTRLFVHREGSGEPIMVVHGGPVLDHGYLVAPLRPLATRYELVFFDQRLSGRSDGAVDSASVRLDTMVADIEGVRRSLGLGRVHVLGHSWGGLLALKYALDHPQRVRSLILASPMAPSAALWQQGEAALTAALSPEDTAGMGEVRASPEFAAGDPAAIERLLQLSFRSQLADPALADSLRFHIADDYGERSRQFGFIMTDLADYDLTGNLPELPVPTLVVYGSEEAGAEPGRAALEEALPGTVSFEVVPGAGHFTFLERPAVFMEVVRGFLASLP